MAVPLYSGLPASKMKKMLEKVLTSSLIPAMTGSESFHWWTCFSKAALGTDDLPWRKKNKQPHSNIKNIALATGSLEYRKRPAVRAPFRQQSLGRQLS